MSKPKRRVYWVRWSRQANRWVIVVGPDVFTCLSKTEAVEVARMMARDLGCNGTPTQLRICGKNGRIQTEHTYPRSSDPRRSKG